MGSLVLMMMEMYPYKPLSYFFLLKEKSKIGRLTSSKGFNHALKDYNRPEAMIGEFVSGCLCIREKPVIPGTRIGQLRPKTKPVMMPF